MRLLLVAGEVSGDQHAGSLLDALGGRVGALDVVGVGGEGCRRRGVRLLAHERDLAVVGLVEAVGKLRLARRLLGDLLAEAVRERVEAAVLIDSPDFNLPLARRLKRAGVPVVFYVSPQVWAWRGGRARTLVTLGEAVLVLFRFEKEWYDARNLGHRVRWVGHPLVDRAAEELSVPHPRSPLGTRRLILMPGSREGEIRRILPVMRDAVRILSGTHPGLEVVLVRADSIGEDLLAQVAGEALGSWRVVTGPHLALLAASDVALVTSGTATVEGLLAGVPMVVIYRVNPLTFLLARHVVHVRHVAMANIVSDDGSGARAVPELLQGQATPRRIAEEAAVFLDDPARAAEARARLARGAANLGPPGAGDRAAEAFLAAIGGAP